MSLVVCLWLCISGCVDMSLVVLMDGVSGCVDGVSGCVDGVSGCVDGLCLWLC